MSFIDRMLQDMLHRNMSGKGATRMARKAMRRIGTKRLIMMGGAAVAGGLLTEAARRQHQASREPASRAPSGAPGVTARESGAPALPPVPGRSGAPDLPPVPSAGGAAELPELPDAGSRPPAFPGAPADDVDLDLPPDSLYVALRTMVAAALADGQLSEDERSLIERRLSESTLSDERLAQVRRDLVLPATPQELADLLPDDESPDLLLQLAIVVLRADSDVSAHDSAWLCRLAEALGVETDHLDELQQELVADDPIDDD